MTFATPTKGFLCPPEERIELSTLAAKHKRRVKPVALILLQSCWDGAFPSEPRSHSTGKEREGTEVMEDKNIWGSLQREKSSTVWEETDKSGVLVLKACISFLIIIEDYIHNIYTHTQIKQSGLTNFSLNLHPHVSSDTISTSGPTQLALNFFPQKDKVLVLH